MIALMCLSQPLPSRPFKNAPIAGVLSSHAYEGNEKKVVVNDKSKLKADNQVN